MYVHTCNAVVISFPVGQRRERWEIPRIEFQEPTEETSHQRKCLTFRRARPPQMSFDVSIKVSVARGMMKSFLRKIIVGKEAAPRNLLVNTRSYSRGRKLGFAYGSATVTRVRRFIISSNSQSAKNGVFYTLGETSRVNDFTFCYTQSCI